MDNVVEWLKEYAVVLGSLGSLVGIAAVLKNFFVPDSDPSQHIEFGDNASDVIIAGGDASVVVNKGWSAEEVSQFVESATTGLKDENNDLKASLTTALDDLVSLREESPALIDEAFAQLEAKNFEVAEDIFEKVVQEEAAAGKARLQQAARASRNIGALAFLHDTDKALSAYLHAVEFDPENSSGWNQLGHLQRRIGNLASAEASFKRVLEIGTSSSNRSWQAMALCSLGLIYGTRGDLDKAEEYQLRSLAIEEKLGSKEGVAGTLGNLGLIYQIRGDLDRAEEYHLRSLAIEEKQGFKEGMAGTLGNLGLIYQTRGDLDKAEEYHLRSLAIEEKLGSKEGMAGTLGNLGLIYLTRGDLDKAEEYHLRSLAISEEVGFKEGMAVALGNLGLIYLTRGDLDKAEEHWHRSLKLFKSIGAKPMVERVQRRLDDLRG